MERNLWGCFGFCDKCNRIEEEKFDEYCKQHPPQDGDDEPMVLL